MSFPSLGRGFDSRYPLNNKEYESKKKALEINVSRALLNVMTWFVSLLCTLNGQKTDYLALLLSCGFLSMLAILLDARSSLPFSRWLYISWVVLTRLWPRRLEIVTGSTPLA